MRNGEIAEAFEELASLYELDGAVVYRVVAYRNAAKAIREAGVSVEELAQQGRVAELAGRRQDDRREDRRAPRDRLDPRRRQAEARIPSGLVEITRIPGLGPKRAKLLYDELGVESIDELREAAEQGRAQGRAGLRHQGGGERAGGACRRRGRPRPRAACCCPRRSRWARSSSTALRDHPSAMRVELAGSARRWADTCKDLDIVAASSDPAALVRGVRRLAAIDVVHRPARPAPRR